ncbi:MAG: response regulator transcription factor [Pseudomonadales bacterium]|nr:response regulator transcription factor [Halieaceae bacterium]MCP5189465.1 response regulator transcription factor [Pseudomonadales bacterium]MCP5205259.1 response regulator transcription factor [Pseudomonadales bacterium]
MNILIVDDESLARERLQRLVGALQPDACCWQAATGEQALEQVQACSPDLILLDIRMPGMDGIELAAHLDNLPQPPAVIFCTAYDEYALQALRHQAVAYLLKPVRESELARALAGAGRINRMQLASLAAAGGRGAGPAEANAANAGLRTRLVSHTHRGVATVAVEDVRCLLADQKYVTACSPGSELIISDSLKELEEEFGDRFLRVHRNALVALAHVQRLERQPDGRWCAVLEGVDKRPAVSRRHLAQAKQRVASA